MSYKHVNGYAVRRHDLVGVLDYGYVEVRVMKEIKDLHTIIFCLVCVCIMPFTTLMYIAKRVTLMNVLALIVNILSIPPVIVCLYKEKKNKR